MLNDTRTTIKNVAMRVIVSVAINMAMMEKNNKIIMID